MIDISAFVWLKLLVTVLLSTMAGLSISSFMPWSTEANRVRLPVAFGIALAPMVLGLTCIASLALFPGGSHLAHLISTFIILSLLSAVGLRRIVNQLSFFPVSFKNLSWQEVILLLLLATWVLGLILNALFFPVTKNDALEYATVGRILFEARDLMAYPVLNPTENSAGFYGPWTHPPLYVAMIYFFNVLQGNAILPLLKLISVWASLGATYLTFTMGSLINRKTGLFAAIIFLSCPLYFLGAAEGLIDPLPILGMTLILSSVISLKGVPWKKGLWQGMILGISMWGHSQAILFIPLTIVGILAFNGLSRVKSSLVQVVTCLSSGVLLSFYPYFNNYKLYGSFISDQPLVFEIGELNWTEYFSISRGFYTWWGKVQAGLFKGWFVLDAYSILFWIMTVGIFFYLRDIIKRKAFLKLIHGDDALYGDRVRLSFFCVILCYLGGVVVSLFLNIDLMIRNERYLLILLPAVSLFAADAMTYLTTLISKQPAAFSTLRLRANPLLSVSFLIFFSFCLFAQFFVVQSRQFRKYNVSLAEMTIPFEKKLERSQSYQAMNHLKTMTEKDSVVLSMQPSEMFYSDRRMISYLDPRLAGFYKEKDTLAAYERLQSLGVQYIHVPNYDIPPITNSPLQEILYNSNFSELIFSLNGFQVYKLNSQGKNVFLNIAEPFPGQMPWTKTINFIIAGRQESFRIYSQSEEVSCNNSCFSNVLKEKQLALWSGKDDQTFNHIKVDGNKEYQLKIDLEGLGFITVYIIELNNRHKINDIYQINEFVLASEDSIKSFYKRFITNKDTSYIRIGLKSQGMFDMQLEKIKIDQVLTSPRSFVRTKG